MSTHRQAALRSSEPSASPGHNPTHQRAQILFPQTSAQILEPGPTGPSNKTPGPSFIYRY